METNATHSVYGNFINTLMRMKKNYIHIPFSTLNQRLNIFPDERPNPGVLPSIGYLALGNGGHYADVINNDLAITRNYQHQSTDAGLFKMMPFILRPVANDLTPAQRAGYALRRVETIDSQQYAAYYLKRVDLSEIVPRLEYRTIQPDGTIVVSEFIPDSSNLNPTPTVMAVNGTNTTTSEFVAVSAKVAVPWSQWEINEYLNVSNVKFGTEDAALISELAVVSGVDKIVTSGSLTYTEAICAIVETFVQHKIDLTANSQNFTMNLEIGVSEPLFNIQAP